MDDLDALFAEAKSGAMQPSQGLMARVIADAEALQPNSASLTDASLRSSAGVRGGFFAGLAALFGGAGALAGVGSAALAGLVIGLVQPTAVQSMSGMIAGTTTNIEQVELIPDVSTLLAGE
jgi:hypothetical protein